MEATFDQLVHGNNLLVTLSVMSFLRNKKWSVAYLVNLHSFEGGLQHFEVLYVLMLQFGPEFDFFQLNAIWKKEEIEVKSMQHLLMCTKQLCQWIENCPY